jgi:F-type H+-transporting ATPase subunit delta
MSVAISYAQALYQVTGKENVKQIEDQLSALTTAIQTSTQLRISLYGPVSTAKEKQAIVDELAQILKCSNQMKAFLSILVRKNRLKQLPAIRNAFRAARTAGEGGLMGTMVSADALNDADMQALTDAFSKKLGKKVTFDSKTDAALLAGVKVTVNGVTYDGTLRSQLHRLRDRLVMGTMGEA